MPFSVEKSKDLIGKPRSEYQCNHVVNYMLTGTASNGMLAKDYLSWGIEAKTPLAGVVVVGKNGKHVGIFLSATEFIHSSSSKKSVIKVGLDKLKYVFPEGYVLRRFSLGKN